LPCMSPCLAGGPSEPVPPRKLWWSLYQDLHSVGGQDKDDVRVTTL
jgi:hypothetical protein